MSDKIKIPGIFTSVLLILGSYILVYFITSISIQIIVGGKPADTSPSTLKWFMGIMELLLLLLPTWYLIRGKFSLRDIYFLKRIDMSYALWVVLFSVGVFPLTDELDRIVQIIFGFEPVGEEFFQMMKAGNAFEFLYLLISIAGIAAVAEEFLFRGLIFSSFAYKLGPTQGILFSALIWAFLHGIINWTLQIFIIGLILGLLVFVTRSIWPAVIFHALNNAFTLIFVNMNEQVINSYYEYNGHVQPLILVIAAIIVFFSAKKCLFMGTNSVKL